MAVAAERTSATSQAAAAGQPRQGEQIPTQTNVTVSVMDSFVPTIPEASTDAIEAKFPHKTLTKIEGQPTYADFFRLREELYRNALSSKSLFGGGNHGHLGACMDALTYSIETGGVNWTVPDSAGMFPLFPAGATDDRKKQIIAKFVRDETGIKVTNATVNLLRNQLIEAVDKDYFMELYDNLFRSDRMKPVNFLAHILKHYAVINDDVLEENTKQFNEPPNMSLPINV